jgi:hypothetical protein
MGSPTQSSSSYYHDYYLVGCPVFPTHNKPDERYLSIIEGPAGSGSQAEMLQLKLWAVCRYSLNAHIQQPLPDFLCET